MVVAQHRDRVGQPAQVSAEALHYSLVIEWDPRGDVYVVTVPELPGCRTHGATYVEAINQAAEAIESWVERAIADGAAVPAPSVYHHRGW